MTPSPSILSAEEAARDFVHAFHQCEPVVQMIALISMLKEHDALIRSDERSKALEEAAKVNCVGCRMGLALDAISTEVHIKIVDGRANRLVNCQSVGIRSLIPQPPRSEGKE